MVLRKVISLLFVLLLVLTVEFLFLRVGVGEEGYVGKGAPVEVAGNLHFDQPPIVQYFLFLGDMFTGKGAFDAYSYTAHSIVKGPIERSLPWTIVLFEISLALSLLLGFLTAFFAERTRRVRVKKTISLLALLVWTVPIVLVAFFFMIQIVMRFGLWWGFRFPMNYSSMSGFSRMMSMIEFRFFPMLILVVSTFGGFALIALQGLRRVERIPGEGGLLGGTKGPSFAEGIISVMPSLKLNIALTMSFMLFVDMLWNLRDLGSHIFVAMLNLDLVMVEASVFVVVVIVALTGLVIDVLFSLLAVRARRRNNLTAPQPVGGEEVSDPSPAGSSKVPWRGLLKEIRWFASEYRRSALGVVAGLLVLAMGILALVGPMIAKPYGFSPFGRANPVDQFLIGARDPFLEMIAVLAFSMIIGFGVALLVVPFGRLNYPAALLAESFLVFPIVIIIFLASLRRGDIGHLINGYVAATVLITWAPVALTVICRTDEVSSAFDKERPTTERLARYRRVLLFGARKTLPEAVASLKFVTVVGTLSIFTFEYLLGSFEHSSWPGMISYAQQNMLLFRIHLWWVLPLVGMVLLISGFYLVLDVSQSLIERRLRMESPSPLQPPASP